MKLIRMKDNAYFNANVIKEISLNDGNPVPSPEESIPEIFQYYLTVSFNTPVNEEMEKVLWIGKVNQREEALRLFDFLIRELTDRTITIVDLRLERFTDEFINSL